MSVLKALSIAIHIICCFSIIDHIVYVIIVELYSVVCL